MIGEKHKRDVRLTITGLHGRGLHSGKAIPDAKKYQELKNVDFVEHFFSRQEQNLSMSASQPPIPAQAETPPLSKQLPSSPKVPTTPDEASTINDAPEHPSTSPHESVQEPGRNQGDQAVGVDVVPNTTPSGVTPQTTVRGQGPWIRDILQAVPYWGVSNLALCEFR
jgi:hypothetical protein